MITKGIIKSIDLLGNTCKVHIPFFETAGNDPIIETATVSNTPGSYNGYKVGDVVYVAFEDGSMSTPVVIGKLYLGTEKEKADPRGVSNVEESTAAKKATLPADSKLSANLDSSVPNTTVPYNSLSSIANGLNSLSTTVDQNDRDYGNRFKQVSAEILETGDTVRAELVHEAASIRATIDSTRTTLEGTIADTKTELEVADGKISAEVARVETELDGRITANSTSISANADAIKLEATTREEAIGTVTKEYTSAIEQTAKNINARVDTKLDYSNKGGEEQDLGDGLISKGLGWDLTNDHWTVKAYDQNAEGTLPEDGLDIFKITRDTVEINAPYVKLSGYPKSTTITYLQVDSETAVNDSNKDEFDWEEEVPEWVDGKYIWQRTVVRSWEYRETDKLDANGNTVLDTDGNPVKIETWVDTVVSDKIVCLAGASAASYWLNCSTKSHNGDKQLADIEVIAMMKIGTKKEEEDTAALLEYRWAGEEKFTPVGSYALPIEADEVKNKNLEIIAKRNDVEYARETIVYAPLNTPIVVLNSDTNTILYTSDGSNLLGAPVSATATLYLNGSELAATYSWELDKCSTSSTTTITKVEGKTVTVAALSADTATAVCTATVTAAGAFENLKYQKTFTVSKTYKGDSASSPYIIDIYNDTVTVLTETPAIAEGTYDWEANTTHEVQVFQGPALIPCSEITVKSASETGTYIEENTDKDLVLTYALTNIKADQFKEGTPTTAKHIFSISELETANTLTGQVAYCLYYQGTLVATEKFKFSKILTGVSITKVINKYYATKTATEEVPDPNTYPDLWKGTIGATDPKYGPEVPYLWNYEIIEYSSGDPTITTPALIGSRGKGIKALGEYYILTATSASPRAPEIVETTDPETEESVKTVTYGDWKTVAEGGPTQPTSTSPYLWNVEKVEYTDGDIEFTDPALIGTYTRSITEVKNWYYATANEDANTATPADGGEKLPAVDVIAKDPDDDTKTYWKSTIKDTGFSATRKYLWNYEEVFYDRALDDTTPNDKSKTTEPELISIWSKEVREIKEFYLISKSMDDTKAEGATEATFETSTNREADWTESFKPPTSTYPYLWNKEITYYTDGTDSSTKPIIVGTFARSIIGVKNYYIATKKDDDLTNPLTQYNGEYINEPYPGMTTWQDSIAGSGFSSVYKYLWNYEEIIYDLPLGTDDKGNPITTSTTAPEIISVWSKSIDSIEELYLISKSNGSDYFANRFADWDTAAVSPNSSYPYLWNKEITYFTDGTSKETTPIIIGTYGETFGVNIVPSVSSIILHDEDGIKTYNPASVTVKFTEVAGTVTTECGKSTKREYKYLIYTVENGEQDLKVGPIELTATATTATINTADYPSVGQYKVELLLNNKVNNTDNWVIVDAEHIPVVHEGNNGHDATAYRLKCSTRVHTGSSQKDAITATAMKKTGHDPETEDKGENGAILWYRYDSDISWSGGTSHAVTITTHKNEDLYILSTHTPNFTPDIDTTSTNENVSDWETITYSPLNTPVLDLSNDSASIAYNGNLKLGNETVSCTANLYLNGEILDAEILWFPSGCTTIQTATPKWYEKETITKTAINSPIITISALSANTVTIPCWAFEKLYDVDRFVYRPAFTEAEWTTYGTLNHTETWTNAPKVNTGNYFVVIGKSTDEGKSHVLWYQSQASDAADAYGTCIDHKIFYEKDFTITKQLKGDHGVSIISQTTYYALIKNSFDAGELLPPEEGDLEIKSYLNYNPTTGVGDGEHSLAEGVHTVKDNWELQPPAHTATTIEAGWKYWTTVRTEKTDGSVEFSIPIINEEVTGAYALAQGKTTNYYQVNDPTTSEGGSHPVKKGDCWFKTVTADNTDEYNSELGGSQGKLYQWTGTAWEDIGGELVTNKLTANYINALDITAKKVTVLDSKNSGLLFDANGLGYDSEGKAVDPYVKIAGFNVEANTLTTGTAAEGNLIKLNSDSTSQYNFYGLTPSEYINFVDMLNPAPSDPTSISVKDFQKADSLWVYKSPTDTEEKHYLAFSVSNASNLYFDYAITKVIFNQPVTKPFTFYIRDTSLPAEDYVIVSKLNAATIPTQATYGYAYTSGQGSNLKTVTFDPASSYPSTKTIPRGAHFYIVYRHLSGDTTSTYKGQVYLPVDVRMTIGDNFQVLADGSVYANNVFLGGVTKDSTGGTYGPDSINEESPTTSGTLAAVKIVSGGDENKKSLKDDNLPGVYIGPDGISIGTGFKVEAGGSPIITNVQLTPEQQAQFTPTVYWIASSCEVHTGTKHGTNIVVTAMKKVGGATEAIDTDAYLWWKYKNTSDPWACAAAKYRINFTFPDEVLDDDILVIATHKKLKSEDSVNGYDPNDSPDLVTDSNIYEREEIPFSPANSPILNLTNDSGALAYSADGKTSLNGVAISQAELWLNGSRITSGVEYEWESGGCSIDKETTAVANDTVYVWFLPDGATSADVTCTATYKDETFRKVFTVSKQFSGASPVKLEIENDYDSIPCDADGTIGNYDYANTEHKLRLFEGTTAVAFKVAKDSIPSGNTGYVIVYSLSKVTANLTARTTASTTAYKASITGLSDDTGKINYTVYKGTSSTVLATGCFTAEKRYAGDPSVDYYLLTEPTQVKYNPTDQTYIPSNKKVKVTFWKQEGNNAPEELKDKTFAYSINNGSKTSIGTAGFIEPEITTTTTIKLYTDNTASATLLDTETISVVSDGSNGSTGTSVNNITKYYKLTNSDPTNDFTGYTGENPPTGKGWSTSPEAFDKSKHTGYKYWETIRTTYKAANNNLTYSWSTPVECAMMSVDFLDSIGITAKKIKVGNKFEADATATNTPVKIGGFDVGNTYLTAGTNEDTVYIGTNQIYMGSPGAQNAPFKVTSDGKITAQQGEISGFEIGRKVTQYDDNNTPIYGPVFQATPDSLTEDDLFTIQVHTSDVDYWKTTNGPIIKQNGKVVTSSYKVYHCPEGKSSNSVAFTIKFVRKLREFSLYTATYDTVGYTYRGTSMDETAYSYIGISKRNSEVSFSWSDDTWGTPSSGSLQDSYSVNYQTGAAPTSFELTNSAQIHKVTLSDINPGDLYTVYFLSTGTNARGYVVIPFELALTEIGHYDRAQEFWITPEGSTASLGFPGTDNSQWGITLGNSFGVTLDGKLYAENSHLAGSITATSGRVGGFNISESTLYSDDGISIAPGSMSITTNQSTLSLGVDSGSSRPYVQFNNKGALWGPGKKCGFLFDGATSSTQYKYYIAAYVDGSKVSATLYQLVPGASATYYEPTAYNCKEYGLTGLLENKTITVDVAGYIKSNRNSKNYRETTATLTFYGGGSSKISTTIDYDFKNNIWTDAPTCKIRGANASPIGRTSDNAIWFSQTLNSADGVISIGSIIPESTANGITLGASGKAWHTVYANRVVNNSGTEIASDRKIKNTIDYDISRYDSLFDDLKPASYKYNNGTSERTHLGFIAQDISNSVNATGLTSKDCSIVTIEGDGFDKELNIVTNEENTSYYIRPNELHALEVRQIQLLKEQVKQQEARITELEQLIKNLKN